MGDDDMETGKMLSRWVQRKELNILTSHSTQFRCLCYLLRVPSIFAVSQDRTSARPNRDSSMRFKSSKIGDQYSNAASIMAEWMKRVKWVRSHWVRYNRAIYTGHHLRNSQNPKWNIISVVDCMTPQEAILQLRKNHDICKKHNQFASECFSMLEINMDQNYQTRYRINGCNDVLLRYWWTEEKWNAS